MKLTGPPGTLGVLKATSNACKIQTAPRQRTIKPKLVLMMRPSKLNMVTIVIAEPSKRLYLDDCESSRASQARASLQSRITV